MLQKLTCESRSHNTQKVNVAMTYFTYSRKDSVVSLPRIRQQVPNICAILSLLMAKTASFHVLSFLKITLGKAVFFFKISLRDNV